jgi:hypothetical protein
MNKTPFIRICPDCGKDFVVNDSYDDDAYQGHLENRDDHVCPTCFDAFDGLTLEEILAPDGYKLTTPLAAGVNDDKRNDPEYLRDRLQKAELILATALTCQGYDSSHMFWLSEAVSFLNDR